MSQPIIGITLDHRLMGEYSKYPWYALRQNYCDAIFNAGGLPVVIPYGYDNVEDYLAKVDGLLMPGGDFDVDPHMYGKEISHDRVSVNPFRSSFDFKILHEAIKIGKPFLGICAGHQMLNVVMGGTLHQHVPDVTDNQISHEQKGPKHEPSHSILIKPHTRLHDIARSDHAMVNSSHHQAVDRLGKGLVASASAPDSVIEAIEISDHPFCMGIEWHPEYQTTELDRSIFTHFIRAASVGSYS